MFGDEGKKMQFRLIKAVDAPGKNQYHLPTDFSIAGVVQAVCWLQFLSSSQYPLQILLLKLVG